VHNTIWCCRSGSAADTQAVADIVRHYLGMYEMVNGTAPTTQVAASLFHELCYANKDNLTCVVFESHVQKQRTNRLDAFTAQA
jgi:20S proteasome subunit beta 1